MAKKDGQLIGFRGNKLGSQTNDIILIAKKEYLMMTSKYACMVEKDLSKRSILF